METQLVVDTNETQSFDDSEMNRPFFQILNVPRTHESFSGQSEAETIKFTETNVVTCNRNALGGINAYSRSRPVATATLNVENNTVKLVVGPYANISILSVNNIRKTVENEVIILNIGDKIKFCSNANAVFGELSSYELVGPPDYNISSVNTSNLTTNDSKAMSKEQMFSPKADGTSSRNTPNTLNAKKVKIKKLDLILIIPELEEELVLMDCITEETKYSDLWDIIKEQCELEDLPLGFSRESYFFYLNDGKSRVTKTQEKNKCVKQTKVVLKCRHKRKLQNDSSNNVDNQGTMMMANNNLSAKRIKKSTTTIIPDENNHRNDIGDNCVEAKPKSTTAAATTTTAAIPDENNHRNDIDDNWSRVSVA